jgi:hypothetical protein
MGDFNSDGKADILWRQSTTGALGEWQMNGATIASSTNVTFQGSAVTPDASWSIAGVGDFNGDGKADILWRQGTTGSLVLWSMNGATIAQSATVVSQGSAVVPDASWSVVQISDFDGSGNSQILWRQATTGSMLDWHMNGAQIVTSQAVTSQGASVLTSGAWQNLAKPADFV